MSGGLEKRSNPVSYTHLDVYKRQISYSERRRTFYLTLTGFALFMVALLVTVLVEVPIVKQIETWTVATLPGNWQQLRDRWGAFHVVRMVASGTGLVLLVIVAIF